MFTNLDFDIHSSLLLDVNICIVAILWMANYSVHAMPANSITSNNCYGLANNHLQEVSSGWLSILSDLLNFENSISVIVKLFLNKRFVLDAISVLVIYTFTSSTNLRSRNRSVSFWTLTATLNQIQCCYEYQLVLHCSSELRKLILKIFYACIMFSYVKIVWSIGRPPLLSWHHTILHWV